MLTHGILCVQFHSGCILHNIRKMEKCVELLWYVIAEAEEVMVRDFLFEVFSFLLQI